MKKRLKLSAVGLLLVASLVTVIQNQEPTTTTVLFWSFTAPRFVLLAAVLLVGILAGYVIGRGTRIVPKGR